MPVPPPADLIPAEVRPVQAADLRTQNQDATSLQGQTSDLQQREKWIPVGGQVLGDQVSLQADSQQYSLDEDQFVASGNVRMDFRNSYLLADALQVDLVQRIAVARGNIRLVRGGQEVTGERLEYNFAREEGVFYQAKGVLNTQTFNRLDAQIPTTQQGRVVRFRADRIVFSAAGWEGEGVKITNDPFDPPELEVSAQKAVVTRRTDGTEYLDTGPGFLVFDQTNYLPLPSLGLRLGGQEESSEPWTIGYDAQDKGGLFYQQNFNFLLPNEATLKLSPRIFVQQALGLNDQGENIGFSFEDRAQDAQAPRQGNIGENLGLGLEYKSAPGKRQRTTLFAELNGFSFEQLARRVRVRAEQRYLLDNFNALSFSYTYRDRLFNGIFGNQPVSQRFEVSLTGEGIRLDPETKLNYTVGLSMIQAPSDREGLALAEGPSGSPEITLGRFQVGAEVVRRIPLYEAEQTPPTREFLRYTPRPITPNVALYLEGVALGNSYTSGDFQGYLEGSVRIGGTFGRFAKDSLDYTQVSVGYSNALISGTSPFLFDRVVTTQKISANILQQIYGPIRAGFESSWDIGQGREIDRWYTLRYDRRTYGIGISYSPIQQSGQFQFRIDDFNWGVDEEGRPKGPAPIGIAKNRKN